MTDPEFDLATAEEIVADLRYVVLATADDTGLPWASPVYYAHRGLAEFFWVSRPETTHSQNITRRPQVGLVVFDSRQPINTGRAVYARATAGPVAEDGIAEGLEIFSQRTIIDDADAWDRDRLRSSGLALYRARTHEVSLLPGGDRPDIRIPLGRP